MSKQSIKDTVNERFDNISKKIDRLKSQKIQPSNILDGYNITETFIPYKKSLGGRLIWLRKDKSEIGKVIYYTIEGDTTPTQYIISEKVGIAHITITNKGMISPLSGTTYAEKGIMTAIVDDFELMPDMQGKGLGTRLWLERVEPKIKEYGTKVIVITHVMSNATKFWKKVGFKPKYGSEDNRTWIKNL